MKTSGARPAREAGTVRCFLRAAGEEEVEEVEVEEAAGGFEGEAGGAVRGVARRGMRERSGRKTGESPCARDNKEINQHRARSSRASEPNESSRERGGTHRLDVDHLEHGLAARELGLGRVGLLDAAPVVRHLLDAEVRLHALDELGLEGAALRATRINKIIPASRGETKRERVGEGGGAPRPSTASRAP